MRDSDRPLRIAMIGPFGLAPKGTMSARALPLARDLATCGHTVRILMPPWHTPEQAGRTWTEKGVTLTYVKMGPSWSPITPLTTTARLVRDALAMRPDIVHCFKPKAYAGLAAWLFWHWQKLGLFKGKLIIDEDDWEGAGGWNELEPYPGWLKAFFSWQETWGLTHNDGLVVASRALETCAWSRGISPERMLYLPNGGQPERLGDGPSIRQKLGLGTAPVVLLYTRFFEYAPERAALVFARIVEQIPTARLLIVGDALFAKDSRQFDQAAQGLAIERHVIRLGWQNDWQSSGYLQSLLATSDCAIYPMDDTLINRTKCPAKLISLLFAGVPVIADAVGQTREYVSHSTASDLVPAGNEEAMAARAIERLRARGETGECRRNAEATARLSNQFGWPKLGSKLTEFYYHALTRDL